VVGAAFGGTAVRGTAIGVLLLALAGCERSAPAPVVVPAPPTSATQVDVAASRAWLTRALTCGDREFLRSGAIEQRARLQHLEGAACEAAIPGQPLRCAIAPALKIGRGEIPWFVIGAAGDDLVPVILPAPADALRTAMPAGSGALLPGTDLGDTTVQCALSDIAFTPGAIAGVVRREGEPSASVRVCAFELAEGMPACMRTTAGQRDYTLTLPRGDYLVLAVPGDAPDVRVGYTDCDDTTDDTPCLHELQVVTVRAGETTRDINPGDVRPLDDVGDWPQPPPAE
jgi:hypothetical protein